MNLFLLTYILWISSEIYLNRSLRSSKTDRKALDEKTELLLWGSSLVSIIFAVLAATEFTDAIFNSIEGSRFGLLLIVVGILLRVLSIKQLGKYFTVNVTIRENHKLVQRGLYKFVRHPSYSASLISFIGFGLSLNNWISFGIVFIPTLLAFIKRMNVEEKVLKQEFGSEYQEYILKTKRLFPFLY